MLKTLISFSMIILSLYMYMLNNPLSMGLMIITQTLLSCLISGMMVNTYWFSYILFLTFLGGLLVLFIYVSSIASNEIFYFSNNSYMYMLFLTFILILFSMMNYKNLNWLNFNMNEEMNKTTNFFIFMNNENKINLSKLYNNQTFMMMMMIIIYLFITLISIVKITNIFYGPIRSNSY